MKKAYLLILLGSTALIHGGDYSLAQDLYEKLNNAFRSGKYSEVDDIFKSYNPEDIYTPLFSGQSVMTFIAETLSNAFRSNNIQALEFFRRNLRYIDLNRPFKRLTGEEHVLIPFLIYTAEREGWLSSLEIFLKYLGHDTGGLILCQALTTAIRRNYPRARRTLTQMLLELIQQSETSPEAYAYIIEHFAIEPTLEIAQLLYTVTIKDPHRLFLAITVHHESNIIPLIYLLEHANNLNELNVILNTLFVADPRVGPYMRQLPWLPMPILDALANNINSSNDTNKFELIMFFIHHGITWSHEQIRNNRRFIAHLFASSSNGELIKKFITYLISTRVDLTDSDFLIEALWNNRIINQEERIHLLSRLWTYIHPSDLTIFSRLYGMAHTDPLEATTPWSPRLILFLLERGVVPPQEFITVLQGTSSTPQAQAILRYLFLTGYGRNFSQALIAQLFVDNPVLYDILANHARVADDLTRITTSPDRERLLQEALAVATAYDEEQFIRHLLRFGADPLNPVIIGSPITAVTILENRRPQERGDALTTWYDILQAFTDSIYQTRTHYARDHATRLNFDDIPSGYVADMLRLHTLNRDEIVIHKIKELLQVGTSVQAADVVETINRYLNQHVFLPESLRTLRNLIATSRLLSEKAPSELPRLLGFITSLQERTETAERIMLPTPGLYPGIAQPSPSMPGTSSLYFHPTSR